MEALVPSCRNQYSADDELAIVQPDQWMTRLSVPLKRMHTVATDVCGMAVWPEKGVLLAFFNADKDEMLVHQG
jgi:hypothetical protein